MPIKSVAQQGWMFANKPAMAKRWAAETPNMGSLPMRAGMDNDEDEKKKAKMSALKMLMMKKKRPAY
jgi:hypothetical protein